jgi:protein-tyrosine-phosphatase
LKRVLFVCSGNTCRSPLAEGIAKDVLPRKLSVDISVSSAGTAALDGYPASGLAAKVAANGNIDISNHRSRLLTKNHIVGADLIVTMEAKHRETVGVIEPAALSYTYLMTDFCEGHDVGVPDPIGGDLAAYQRTFDLLLKCIDALSKRLDDFDGWKQ